DAPFAETAQQAQMIFAHRLLAAAVVKGANAAMVIEQQFRRHLSPLQAFGVSKENVRRLEPRSKTNGGPCGIATEIDGRSRRKRGLHPCHKNSEYRELTTVTHANAPRRGKHHRFVIKIAEGRGARDSAKAIEHDSVPVIVQAGIQKKRNA